MGDPLDAERVWDVASFSNIADFAFSFLTGRTRATTKPFKTDTTGSIYHTKYGGDATVVFLDDFESFTEQTRKEIASYFRKTEHDISLGGIVLTLNQIRDPSMRDVAHLDNARLFPPYENVLREWFSREHPWTEMLPNGRTEKRRGFGEQLVSLITETLSTRDMRRIETQLKWLKTHSSLLQKHEKSFDNIFNATRQLFSKDGDWAWWANNAEDRDLLLLKEHFPTYQMKPDGPSGQRTMDITSSTLDLLSFSASLEPSAFELRDAQRPYQMCLSALAVCSTTQSRDVGALAPPARLPATLDLRGERTQFSPLLRMTEYLDLPASLGGPEPRSDRTKRTYASGSSLSNPA